MAREEVQLEASLFTTGDILAKEISYLLALTDHDYALRVKADLRSLRNLFVVEAVLKDFTEVEVIRLDDHTLLIQRKEPPCQPTS